MADVFISSIQSGFEDVRAGARAGVENFGHRAVMAETTGAVAASPQRALLDRVAAADIFLHLVGPRYGARQAVRPLLRSDVRQQNPTKGLARSPLLPSSR